MPTAMAKQHPRTVIQVTLTARPQAPKVRHQRPRPPPPLQESHYCSSCGTPGLPWLLEALGHIPGCHVWHLCMDEIHVEDVITVSREALAVGLCATCCRHPMPLASGADVEALAERLEQDADTYHAANQATVVFLPAGQPGQVLVCNPPPPPPSPPPPPPGF